MQGHFNRRALLQKGGLSLGSAALSSLLARDLSAAPTSDPTFPRDPHFAPKAKHVIYLHMIGAPSQLDLFDYKPELIKRSGQACPPELLEGKRFAFIGTETALQGTPFAFKQQGQSGTWMSELLPHLSTVADDLCVIKSLHTNEINHAPAQMFLHSGFGQGGRPSMGSWVTYGLGSENSDLPAYVVMLSGPPGGAGTALWSTGFLPSVYQGIQFRSEGDAVLFLSNPEGHSRSDRRQVLDAVKSLNEERLHALRDPEIATRIAQYEMAYKMQTSVPELTDFSKEPKHILEMYGPDVMKQGSYAYNCLMARRLAERGVRFIQLMHAGWDQHRNLNTQLKIQCQDTDGPSAALVKDLKQRGLLEDTLVIWGGEFGRTPFLQGKIAETKQWGRDHHPYAFTTWMAGGGVKAGYTHGASDEFGFSAVQDPVHVHDFQATLMHLLGIDHEKLTYKFQGRYFRLTDVHGHVVKPVLA